MGHDKLEASATHQSADIKKLLFRADGVARVQKRALWRWFRITVLETVKEPDENRETKVLSSNLQESPNIKEPETRTHVTLEMC